MNVKLLIPGKTSIVSILVLIFSCFCQGNFAQSIKIKEVYQDGEDFFEAEDYKEAIYNFLIVEEKGIQNPNLKYKIGVCYLNIPGEEIKAVPYLEEAIKHITTKYKSKDIEEKQTPLHSLFYLGNAYRCNNQLDKALEAYSKFINAPDYEGKYNVGIVEKEIHACERAKIIQDSPIDITWSNLGSTINTTLSETHPVLSGDEKMLVYLVGLKFYNAIYVSRKVNNVWLPPDNINPQILSDGDFFPTAISFDGSELYFIKTSGANTDIYVSNFKDGRWSIAKPLNSNINSLKDESAASITADGKVLYFSSNRHGDFDLYRSFRTSGNDWGKAENLGKVINTNEDETDPSISPDGKTLYFSSKGHFNMGGYDIFCATLKKDKWGYPINIGFPINTTNDNLGFKTIGDGKVGYISRITSDGYGKDDIYRVEIRTRFFQKDTLERK